MRKNSECSPHSVMGPVPNFSELRSVPFLYAKMELVPFSFPNLQTGTSSVPVPFPFPTLAFSFQFRSHPWNSFRYLSHPWKSFWNLSHPWKSCSTNKLTRSDQNSDGILLCNEKPSLSLHGVFSIAFAKRYTSPDYLLLTKLKGLASLSNIAHFSLSFIPNSAWVFKKKHLEFCVKLELNRSGTELKMAKKLPFRSRSVPDFWVWN